MSNINYKNSEMLEHKQDLERIANFCLMDDEFMSKVFSENTKAIEFVLQTLLDSPTLEITYLHTQDSIKNLFGKDVVLDVYCKDARKRVFNVEIQRKDQGAAPQRARYHASIIDTKILKPGEKHVDLNESYVIFITENDYFNCGKPLYHVDRTVAETGLPFEDFQHIIYVNGQYKSEDPLGQLIHDFWCTDAKKMNNKILRDSVGYYKDNKEGTAAMCRSLEKMREETRNNTLSEVIHNMMSNGMSVDMISSILNLPLEEVQALCQA